METDTLPTTDRERADLLEALAKQRGFLRQTTWNLTDEQAGQHSTVSELCLGGLVKHVADVESAWVDFIMNGPGAMSHATDDWTGPSNDWTATFQMLPDETLAGVLEHYDEVTSRTDQMIVSLPNLDDGHPLPTAPWFPKDGHWSARRVLLHVIAETAQHAGHADIIRESIDGSKTMG
jgi:hypothetical protein